MDFSLKLNKSFVAALNRLEKKYGEKFMKLNGIHESDLNFTEFIDNFIDKGENLADLSINPSANTSAKDIVNLESNITEPHRKLLAYNKIFYELTKKYGRDVANEWLESDFNGALYLHDAPSSTFKPYCWAADLDQIAEKGLFFIDKFKTGPAQHLSTFADHFLEATGWLSNRQSGAVGWPSFFVYSFYFWNKDVKEGYYMKDPEYYRRQHFQKIIYDLNQPYLRINQSAFTNFSIMDHNYLIELFGGREYPDGSPVMDYIDDIIEHQKVFLEVLSEIRKTMMATFPVLTFSLLYQDGKFVDEEFAKWCCEHNDTWYDSNFYVGNSVTSLSNCCRLISDTSKLDAFINSIGGTSLSIGSVKVSTINLRRIALEAAGDKDKYIEILRHRVKLDLMVLDRVRAIIKRNVEKGLLPNYTFGLVDMEKQYCTIGCTAMFEALDDFGLIDCDAFGNKSYSDEGLEFAIKIMDTINEEKDKWAEGVDYSVNVEFIPGESANTKLARKDSLLYPNAYQHYIYGNQWIPLKDKCTLQEKIRLGAILDRKCGGGQISHINISGPFVNHEQSWNLLNYIASQGVIYFAYNVKINTCEDGHAWIGYGKCPRCGKQMKDQYTRIVGFLTPVSSWSSERKKEFTERTWFDINHEDNH